MTGSTVRSGQLPTSLSTEWTAMRRHSLLSTLKTRADAASWGHFQLTLGSGPGTDK